jgi:5-methylcytosine-specific restriction endonuclease McrA
MSRCTATRNLEVHHKRRDGGNDITNAQVLCQSCHSNTSTYGTPGKSPPDFSEATKQEALQKAGHQCECMKDNCH